MYFQRHCKISMCTSMISMQHCCRFWSPSNRLQDALAHSSTELSLLCSASHAAGPFHWEPADSCAQKLHSGCSAGLSIAVLLMVTSGRGAPFSAYNIRFGFANACSIAKAAQDSMTENWALKYAKDGIRINAVRPGGPPLALVCIHASTALLFA